MNKKEFVKMIFETIDNIWEREEQINAITGLLDTLDPKNRDQFALWGQPKQKSTPEKCWK